MAEKNLVLGDVCTFANGKAHEKLIDQNGEYILVTSKFISSDGESYRRTNDRLTPLSVDDLCMVMSDVPDGRALAKCFLIDKEDTYTLNQRIGLFRADDRYNKRYFYYMMNRNRYFLSFNDGNAQTNLRKDDILKCPVKCPSISEQEKVVNVLDGISSIISKRNQQIEDLDILIKARFVEMFGDPVLNPMGWESKSVIDECDCMVPGRDKPKSFSGDIPWITIEDLKVNGVTYLSKSGLGLTIDEVNRKAIPEGSVIMSCVGNLGICSIAGGEMIINQQLHSFQCGERVNNVFLMNYLGYRKDYMNKWASNTTVLYMNKSICNSIPLIIPPMELQEQFADFVHQVDKSKFEVKKSLDETQLFFDSLMQIYFE